MSVLLAEAPSLERASKLTSAGLPVLEAFAQLLPYNGLRPGTSVEIAGVGATSLALALAARASHDSWTAVVGLPALGLYAADELGVSLDRLVVVADPDKQWTAVLAALVDAFDLVLARPPAVRDANKIVGRLRERDAILLVVGRWPGADVQIQGATSTWQGIGRGTGHLSARTLSITVTGRGSASRPRRATLWLPDPDGHVRLADDAAVVPIHRTS